MGTLGIQMQPFFQWLVRSTFQAGLIVCLILLLQALFRNRLGVRWHHALWLILVIRMVLPWAPQSRWSVFNLVAGWDRPHESYVGTMEPSDRTSVSSSTESSTSQPAGSGPATSADGQPKNVGRSPRESPGSDRAALYPPHRTRDVLPLVWLAGALALGTYVVASNLKLWRAISIEHPSTDKDVLELLEECRARMGLRTIVALVTSEKINTPVLLGFIRPRLLIPRDIVRQLGQEELRYVFLHELAHVKRHDIALAWLTALLQVLHWFNPLVWLAFHRMRADRELACDALVLTRTQGEGTKDYGRAIVSLLERFSFPPPLPGLAGILENKSQLKRRIAMITQFKNNSYRWSPLAVTLIAVLCGISLPDARSGKAAQPASASVSGEQPAARIAEESNVFVDPNTGITFRKARTLSGPSDVVESTTGLQMSPNGKFLLSGVTVVPLDGGQPFTLADLPRGVAQSAWSPNGKKVAFGANGTWVIPVNPETGRPTGPAEKVRERGGGWAVWSPDSEGLRFLPVKGEIPGFGAVSLRDSSLTEVTDGSSPGKRSPDGKQVAFVEFADVQTVLSVKPTAGGPARKVADRATPILWSADSAWLIYSIWHDGTSGSVEEPRFFCLADGREGKVKLPAHWTLVGPSPDGKKLFYYCSSYDLREGLQVISAAGGPPCQLGGQMQKLLPWDQFWSPDSKSIVVGDEFEGANARLWALPLSGAAPVALRVDINVPGKISYRQLSPGLDYLLFCVSSDDKTYDIWGAPVSWRQMRTTGPATLIFKNWPTMAWGGSCTPGFWSPDGKKIAIMQAEKGEIWIASPEGGEPRQLTKGPGLKGWPLWSPDSKMIAFYASLPTGHSLQVIPASGGEAKTVTQFDLPGGGVGLYGRFGPAAWSPDGRALTVAKQRQISSMSISDGQSQPLVNATDIGTGRMDHLRWSPDGKTLAFRAKKAGESGSQLFLFHSRDGHVTKVAKVVGYYFWSPDSKWISYPVGSRFAKTRPEGVLWEMDVEEALAKLAK